MMSLVGARLFLAH